MSKDPQTEVFCHCPKCDHEGRGSNGMSEEFVYFHNLDDVECIAYEIDELPFDLRREFMCDLCEGLKKIEIDEFKNYIL